MNRVVLITGTSSGLGLELALLLARGGDRVYATMRDTAKEGPLLERAAAESLAVHVRQLDVQDPASIERCVGEVLAEAGRIDVLVNNAGAGFVRTTEWATEAEIQWQFDVNLMGVIRCTKAVLPAMREARSGHIVNITSVGGLVGQPFNEMYCAAKFGVEGYTESLASYVQPSFGVKFSLVEPGGIKSEFANSALRQFQEKGGMQDDAYRPILERYIANATGRMGPEVYQTAAEVAAVVAGCIDMDDPPLRMRTSEWGETFCALKTSADPTGRVLSKAVYDSMLG